MTDRATTDDFLSAKRLLLEKLDVSKGSELNELLTKWLREECFPLGRLTKARRAVEAAQGKTSPGGWVLACLRNGTLTAALAASDAQVRRLEGRKDTRSGRGKIEVRQKLAQLYERLHGAPPAPTRLDDDGGLPWKDFALLAPRTSSAVKANLDREIQTTRHEFEQNETTYEMIDPPSWSQWCDVLDQFLDADGARVDAGVEVTSL